MLPLTALKRWFLADGLAHHPTALLCFRLFVALTISTMSPVGGTLIIKLPLSVSSIASNHNQYGIIANYLKPSSTTAKCSPSLTIETDVCFIWSIATWFVLFNLYLHSLPRFLRGVDSSSMQDNSCAARHLYSHQSFKQTAAITPPAPWPDVDCWWEMGGEGKVAVESRHHGCWWCCRHYCWLNNVRVISNTENFSSFPHCSFISVRLVS